MRTRSQARKRRQQQVRQTSVESPNLEKPNPPIVTMEDNRTMAQLLEAPTEGYEDAIVVPEINANNFEIKHGLAYLFITNPFFGHEKKPQPCSHPIFQQDHFYDEVFRTSRVRRLSLCFSHFPSKGRAGFGLTKKPSIGSTWDDLVVEIH
ncbi:hypothetical protein Tco_0156961 [Tanacetum coccineum]